jgi:hypothetical protein
MATIGFASSTSFCTCPTEKELVHAFLWEYSFKRLKLAHLLGQLTVFLTPSRPVKLQRDPQGVGQGGAAHSAAEVGHGAAAVSLRDQLVGVALRALQQRGTAVQGAGL